MNQILHLRDRAIQGLDTLHEGVTSVRFIDFPDHTNVGDSAIALGSIAYWKHRHIRVASIHTLFSTPEWFYHRDDSAVALQGGGSFGGLYAPMDHYRLEMARKLNPDTLLMQMPQSVVFPTPSNRKANQEAFERRKNLRLATRDSPSQASLASLGLDSTLAPDAAHALGPLIGPTATFPYVILARTDPEAADGVGVPGSGGAFDWPRASVSGRVVHRIKYQRPWPNIAQRLADRPPAFWANRAQARVDSGIPLLAAGRTIITDRLHAMILGLHLGRRVIAVDNANQKLSNYANTWLTASDIPLEFQTTFGEAVRSASTTQF